MPLDRSLFPRLKRLFSTDVVIRNIGGNALKVSDVEHIQAFGYLQQNSLIDRFTRLHKAGARMQYNPTLNYQTLRLQLYSDYEAMDTDAIVSSVLDIISHDCTSRGENGDVLTIKSSNERIHEVLHNLFYEVLNIEFNLPIWIRSMCKYGDFYLKMDISEKFGVQNVTPLSVYDIIREEGKDPENPHYVCFRVDPVALAGGNASLYSKQKFENFEVAHFRLLTDPNYLPYGKSYIENGRKVYKQMVLLEDAVLLHRVTRAADKRVFYINIGNIPPNEVDDYMQRVIDKLKRTPYIDPNTGDYNLKFNVQNQIEDFYIPVRGSVDSAATKIDTAKGLEYSGMDDVQYLRDKMLAAFKVPKDRLNYTEDVSGKSTIAGIGVNFSRTIEWIQRIVISELYKIGMIHLYVQEFDEGDLNNFELLLHEPSIISKQEKVALLKEQMDLWTQLKENKAVSLEWFLSEIMGFSESQIDDQYNMTVENAKKFFRLKQIEEEGNDPTVTGESFGTPHDLATLYGQTRYSKPDVPKGYDEDEPAMGRPKEHMSMFGTQDSEFGRDPLGKKGQLEPYKPEKIRPQYGGGGPLAVTEDNAPKTSAINQTINDLKQKLHRGRKIVLFENKETDTEGILSEDNIKDEEID